MADAVLPAGDLPAKKSLLAKLDAWGSSAFPSMGLATLVAALHTRPVQPLPLLFAPALLFSGYVNVAGYAIDAAGMTAAWSGIYAVMAMRRGGLLGRLLGRLPVVGRAARVAQAASQVAGQAARHTPWTPAALRTSSRRVQTPARRAVSTVTIALAALNCAAGTVTYTMGDRAAEAEARRERDRWGMENQ